MNFTVKILGCGSSTGVPMVGCSCTICASSDHHNQRLRSSILLTNDLGENCLIDCGPDLRQQLLTHKIDRLSAVFLTHDHSDHASGIDELRALTRKSSSALPFYLRAEDQVSLEKRYDYIFNPDPNYLGGPPPKLELRHYSDAQPQTIIGLEFIPFTVIHGNTEATGIRVGNFVYIPDINGISENSKAIIQNCELLIIDGLWDRPTPHPSHFNIASAIELGNSINAKRIYITHQGHEVDYTTTSKALPAHVKLCFDGLDLTI